jgi:dehydrogenase/reductase SDR family protein 12
MHPMAPLVDRALEASVVGSFSRIGIGLRRRLEHWDPLDQLGRDRTALVTGASSGIGFATAVALLARGTRVIVTTRDEARSVHTRSALLAAATGHASPDAAEDLGSRLVSEVVDLDHLVSIRGLARRLDGHGPLDVVIHNAGAMHPTREVTDDGLERTWQVNAVAPFLLTMLLIPGLTTRPDPRVIWVSSGGMYTEQLVVKRVDSPRGYRPSVAYARAKRAQVELVRELHRRLGERTGIAFHAMHPGWVRTPGLAAALPKFDRALRPLLRSPEQGADTILHLALSARPEPADDPMSGGRFWADRRVRTFDRLARTVCAADERSALWERLMTEAGIARPDGPV